MEKFQYNYSLSVQRTISPALLRGADPTVSVELRRKFAQETQEFLQIEPPLTVDFDIVRNQLADASNSNIKIYNLNERRRSQILKDNWDFYEPRQVILQAGYGNSFSKIFFGNAVHIYSIREGVDFITEIEAFDGGNAYNNAEFTGDTGSFPAGTTYNEVINRCVSLLSPYGVERGAIRAYDGSVVKGKSFTGSIIATLLDLTNREFYIDSGFAYALRDQDVIKNSSPAEISSRTGLLGTPRRERSFVMFNMIFQPDLKIGDQVDVQSTTGEQYNGINKVVSLHHKGRISNSVSSSVTTQVGLLYHKNFTEIEAA